jgi:hypothetical protein
MRGIANLLSSILYLPAIAVWYTTVMPLIVLWILGQILIERIRKKK